MLRAGHGQPVVLLHGVGASERIWRAAIGHLEPDHDVIAFTAPGHRGGPTAPPGIGIPGIVDHAEHTLDELGLDRPHLAGNSMGGWVALELARRGRAASVCALSPGGCWDRSVGGQRPPLRRIRRGMRLARLTRWALPFLARSAAMRRFGLRDAAEHGDRYSPGELVEFVDDMLGCGACHDLLRIDDELAPFVGDPCPITLAWSEFDRVLPIERDGERARRLVPTATWQVLAGTGHVPMIDDPALVAETIRQTVARANRPDR